MNKLLYYPYINVPRNDWTIRALLYYDSIGAIVPQNYFYEPERFNPDMRVLVQNELITPINPMEVLERPFEMARPFLKYIGSKEFKLEQRRKRFNNENFLYDRSFLGQNGVPISTFKFDMEIFRALEDCGLAKNIGDFTYLVESKTANQMMSYLASVLSNKLNYIPTTDKLIRKSPFSDLKKKNFKRQITQNEKRQVVLRNLIPFPHEINILELRRFKEKHYELLTKFKNKIELIALDENLDINSQLFKERVKELEINKDELYARMTESKFKQVFMGTVCGVVGAGIGFASSANTTIATLSSLPGFINAVFSATQIERDQDIPNQNGMKYLALVDKQLRRPVANIG